MNKTKTKTILFVVIGVIAAAAILWLAFGRGEKIKSMEEIYQSVGGDGVTC